MLCPQMLRYPNKKASLFLTHLPVSSWGKMGIPFSDLGRKQGQRPTIPSILLQFLHWKGHVLKTEHNPKKKMRRKVKIVHNNIP